MGAIDAGAHELSPVVLTSVKLDGSPYIELGMPANYRTIITPEGATLDVRNYTDGFEWSVDDPRILSIENGTVRGLRLGTTTLRVRAHGWDAAGVAISREDSMTVEVTEVALVPPKAEVSFTDRRLEMFVGEQHTIRASIDIYPPRTFHTVSFSSDNPEVASIIQGGTRGSAAIVEARAPGESVIRVTVTAENSRGPATDGDLYRLTVVERQQRSGGGGCNSFVGLPVALIGLFAFFSRKR